MALRKAYENEQRNSLIGPAMICSTLANLKRDPKKRSQPFTIDDFLPPIDGTPARRLSKQSTLDMLRHVQSVQAQVTQAKHEIAAVRNSNHR